MAAGALIVDTEPRQANGVPLAGLIEASIPTANTASTHARGMVQVVSRVFFPLTSRHLLFQAQLARSSKAPGRVAAS